MSFLERQAVVEKYAIRQTLVKRDGISSLDDLIGYVDMRIAFIVYQGTNLEDISKPLVIHAGGYRGVTLAPVILDRGEELRGVYVLYPNRKSGEIIQVPPKSVPTELATSSGISLQVFFTNLTVDQLLEGLRKDGWKDVSHGQESVGQRFSSEIRQELAEVD